MAFQGSDAFAISRAGVLFKTTGIDVLTYVRANLGTSDYRVADIAARNNLDGTMSLGDKVMVDNAVGDATVTAGWALYQWLASNTWRKVAEQESMDVTFNGATNLSYTASPTNGIVISDTGNDATLPLADGTNAGLLSPSAFNKVGFLTITSATDIDAIRTASHAAVTTSGNANTNPIAVAGQALSFNIANLTTAP